jgi:hypothetical protein
MSKKSSSGNVQPVERRNQWHDRRLGDDRRNFRRLQLTVYDCRSGQLRRSADMAGELTDGDIWWSKDATPQK